MGKDRISHRADVVGSDVVPPLERGEARLESSKARVARGPAPTWMLSSSRERLTISTTYETSSSFIVTDSRASRIRTIWGSVRTGSTAPPSRMCSGVLRPSDAIASCNSSSAVG